MYTFDDPETMRKIVQVAETVRRDLDALPRGEGARVRYASKLVAAAEVAFAIWHDPEAQWAYGLLLLKGQERVNARSGMAGLTVIPCRCWSEAQALNLAIGEAGGRA